MSSALSTAVRYGALTVLAFSFHLTLQINSCVEALWTVPDLRLRYVHTTRVSNPDGLCPDSNGSVDLVRIQGGQTVTKRKIEVISCFKMLSKGLGASPGSCTLFI
jgi:hypothetical protein